MAEPQKQHGGSPWYPGGAQYQYPTQQFYPQQQNPPPWANTPTPDQPFPYHQAQAYHHQQMGYYPPHPHPQQQQQQQQHYPPQPMPPPQPLPNPPTQFSYMYGPQDQAWPGGNSMRSYPQLIHPGGNTQDWAEKARAWATAKVAMDSNQPPQSAIPHLYQHYQQPDSQVAHHVDRLQYSVSSTGQDAARAMSHENGTNPVPKQPFNSSEQPMHATSASDSAFNGSGPKGALAPLQVQSSVPQVVSSSFLHDNAPSYGQANSLSDPRGIEKKEGPQLHLPLQQSPSAGFSLQQQSQFVSSAPNDSQQQSFGYSDQLLPSDKEYQKMEFLSHQNFQQQPQYRSSIPPPPPPPRNSSAGEVSEPEFGMPTTANPNWTSAGVSSLVYATQVAGGPQFEPLHPSPMHLPQVPQSSMFGRPQLPQQSLTFPSAGSAIGGPYAIGGSPGLGPVSGPSIFIPDSNGNTGFPERPKKAAVPSWLRELLLKKRAEELSNNTSGVVMTEGSISPKSGMARRLQDNSPGSSDNDDDEREAEIEAAREAAINQEIKRILTEVLLKVTGDLFNEIAEEVVEEDDGDSSPGRRVVTEEHAKRIEVCSPSPPPPPHHVPTAPARVLISSTAKRRSPEIKDGSESEGNDSAVGNVLGLANYGSDGEDEDVRAMNARAASVKEEEAMNNIDGNNEIQEDTEKMQGELKEVKTNGDKEGGRGKDKHCPTPPPGEHLLGNKGFEMGTQSQAEESKSQLIDKISMDRYEKKDIPSVDMKSEGSLAPHLAEDSVNEREKSHGKDRPSQSLAGGREEPSNRRGDRTKDERGNRHGKEVNDPRKDAFASGKERKREDKGGDINKKKGSDDKDRESREKHRIKSRDKTKECEREPERHHRGDKDTRERKPREKRMEPHEMRRNRHRSSSLSNRGRSASRSRSLSSPETRRKHHPRRASRNRSASPSPGISKRRRVSTSRSPPTKHSSRRKSPSPSNEKPRYKRSRSRSPRSHRRKRS